jgi:hypothetical protein
MGTDGAVVHNKLIATAKGLWRDSEPPRTVEDVDELLTTLVALERSMEQWTVDYWKEERDRDHLERVAAAADAAQELEGFTRQLELCVNLMARYEEGSEEHATLSEVRASLLKSVQKLTPDAMMPSKKMSVTVYKRRRASSLNKRIKTVGEILIATQHAWAEYRRNEKKRTLIEQILKTHRSRPTPA